jgi:hypothetical protein
MKTKGRVFNRFEEFKYILENQTGKEMKVFKSDNGGEYTSNEFNDLCVKEGIKRELKIPYNPQ